MKKSIFFLAIFFLSIVASGQGIKEMKIADLEAYIQKSEKPLVINFWATFCRPCVEEIPYFLQTIKAKYKGEVELVLVSLDLPDYYPKRISSFVASNNFPAPIIWLNETDADYFCPRIDEKWSGAIPATLMVNNKKNYRKFYEQQLTRSELQGALNGLAN